MSSKFEIIDNDRLKMIFNSFKIKDHKDSSLNNKSQISSLSDSDRHKENDDRRSIKEKYKNSIMESISKDVKNIL